MNKRLFRIYSDINYYTGPRSEVEEATYSVSSLKQDFHDKRLDFRHPFVGMCERN